MKHLKRFNEANNDDYWSLYSETKRNVTLCLVDLMDTGMRCTTDAVNLYRINLRIDPFDFQKGIKFDDKVKESISWFLEVNKFVISKYNYNAKINIRIYRQGKLDLNFDSSELENKEVVGMFLQIDKIEIGINLTKI